jgi:hypothetical protein
MNDMSVSNQVLIRIKTNSHRITIVPKDGYESAVIDAMSKIKKIVVDELYNGNVDKQSKLGKRDYIMMCNKKAREMFGKEPFTLDDYIMVCNSVMKNIINSGKIIKLKDVSRDALYKRILKMVRDGKVKRLSKGLYVFVYYDSGEDYNYNPIKESNELMRELLK